MTQIEPKTQRPLRESLLPEFSALLTGLEDEEDSSGSTLEAETIIRDAFHTQASDIHVDPVAHCYRIRLRIDGLVVDAMELDGRIGQRIVNQFKVLAKIDPLPSFNAEEGSFYFEQEDFELDLRVTTVPCSTGSKAAIRLLSPPETMTRMEDIGIQQQDAERLNHWINTTSGMLLVAGPTGSGKTTTLYVLLHRLKMLEAHIVTLEEPVEYQVPGINQIQIDAQRGLDFTHGTQSLLRLDPDHVLIGELRAPESAEAAIDVVSSGRSLMATLHSKDAISTVSSLRKMGVSDYDIAGNLSIVIAQRLVRRLCPECKSETVTPERFREVLHRCGESVPKTVWQANGCSQCKGIGYSGRLSIYELWQPTESDKTNIIKHQDEFSLRRSVAANGQRFMLQDGIDKAQSGQTTLEELVRIGVLAPVLENQES